MPPRTPPAAAPLAPPDPQRAARVGAQRQVVQRLGPIGPLEVGPFTPRSYPRPWDAAAGDQRLQQLNWKTGQRNEWHLDRGVVFAAGVAAEWALHVPPGGALELGVAATGPPGELPVEVWVDGVATRSATLAVASGDEALAPWHPEPMPLSAGPHTVAVRCSPRAATRVALIDPVVTAPSERPADNVLLVVVDSQRADTVGVGAAARQRAPLFPTMERLRAEGVEFTQAFSAGNQTRLSTFALLSGQWARFGRFHSVEWDLGPDDKARYYAAKPPLLGLLLSQEGTRTQALGNNVFLFGHQPLGLDTGFDGVTDFRNSTRDTGWMTEAAVAFMERHADQRFMLMVNYNAPHKPYEPPQEDRDALSVGPEWAPLDPDYLGEIHAVDRHLARLLAALDRLGLRGKTTVVLTADHGEVFDERHRCYNRTYDKYCFRNHGQTLFDEEIHVPLVIAQPGRFKPGRVDTAVSLVDLAPTLLALSGAPAQALHLGRDLTPALLGGRLPEVPVRAESRRSVALRFRDQKYVWNDPAMRVRFRLDTLWQPQSGNEELYRLTLDPDETVTRALSEPSAVATMRALLFAQDARHDRLRGAHSARWELAAAAPIRGDLTSLGLFRDVVVEGAGCRAHATGGRLEVALEPGCSLRFATTPADAGVSLGALSVQGTPVAVSDVGVGPDAHRRLPDLGIETADERTLCRVGAAAPPQTPLEGAPPLWLRRLEP